MKKMAPETVNLITICLHFTEAFVLWLEVARNVLLLFNKPFSPYFFYNTFLYKNKIPSKELANI